MKVILLIALVACASATSLYDKYPLNFSPKRSMMNLFTQIENKLKAGGPMDAIERMLDEFESGILNEQTAHDALHEKQEEECVSEFAFREREVADAVGALKEATETLDGCNTQYQRANGDLAITKKQITENRGFLAVIEEARAKEADVFAKKTESYQVCTAAVQESLQILEGLLTGEAEFAQMVKHTNGLLKSAIKIKAGHHVAPIMNALAALSSTTEDDDNKLYEKLRDMLNSLGDRIQEQYFAESEEEEAAIAAFNEDKGRLDETIASLEDQFNQLNNEATELDKCIVTQQGIVSASTAKRDRNQKLWDDAIELCDAVDEEYTQQSDARKQELKLLGMIRERVEERFAEIEAGVRDNMSDDE